ncbi:hypothetical protein M1N67_03260 [Peptococcaceae bacterium]|nr:hypothetical protein [Peptococcaceae bacterium]
MVMVNGQVALMAEEKSSYLVVCSWVSRRNNNPGIPLGSCDKAYWGSIYSVS